MRTAYHQQLDALKHSIGDMCGISGTAMQRATRALLEADIRVAETVISEHEDFLAMAAKADQSCPRPRDATPYLSPVPRKRAGPAYHTPTLGAEAQGSAGGNAGPACKSSMEMLSGERTKAMRPSRGGRLMITPASFSRWQRA